jgi:two-component system, OmpR family, alkaline phosphatase synthesis response regulator PhoP
MNEGTILFLDNSVSTIYRTVDAVKALFNQVLVFKDDAECNEFLKGASADAVLVNLDFFPKDGIQVIRDITQSFDEAGKPRPYLILYSAKQEDYIQEAVYKAGADAFVNFHLKPQVMKVFLRNLVARRKTAVTDMAGVIVDHDRYLVFINGKPVQLPRKEFSIFNLLYSDPGRFFTREHLAKAIWNDPEVGKKRTIDVHICNIRQSLGRQVIQSQKEVGYRLNIKYLRQ